MCKVIETREKLANIHAYAEKGDITSQWDERCVAICENVTVSEIGESWQNRIIKGEIGGQDLINETFEFMKMQLLSKRVSFMDYNKIVKSYMSELNKLDVDGIYELSVKKLNEIGFYV